MMTLEQYQVLNHSYRKTLVFHFGAFAGFYSEYNNMLRAMAFCLVHKIRFVLFSKDATFCNGGGWTDFFEPFTDEVDDDFHQILNVRTPKHPTQTAFFSVFLKRKIKRLLGKNSAPVSWSLYDSLFRNRLVKWRHGIDYFTYDLWEDIVHFSPSADIRIGDTFQGTYYELIRQLDRIVWRYNEKIQRMVNSAIDHLALPDEYVGLHIRGGDKILEANLIEPSQYVSEALKISCVDWFVFTDDYSIVEAVRSMVPGHFVRTLCQPNERGYYHYRVMAEDPSLKMSRIIRMFAAVDLCKKSTFFIGTQSSNPFFVIHLAHNGENCLSLD